MLIEVIRGKKLNIVKERENMTEKIEKLKDLQIIKKQFNAVFSLEDITAEWADRDIIADATISIIDMSLFDDERQLGYERYHLTLKTKDIKKIKKWCNDLLKKNKLMTEKDFEEATPRWIKIASL